MRKRVTYRPGKAQGAFGTIWGGIFVLIGLFVVCLLYTSSLERWRFLG